MKLTFHSFQAAAVKLSLFEAFVTQYSYKFRFFIAGLNVAGRELMLFFRNVLAHTVAQKYIVVMERICVDLSTFPRLSLAYTNYSFFFKDEIAHSYLWFDCFGVFFRLHPKTLYFKICWRWATLCTRDTNFAVAPPSFRFDIGQILSARFSCINSGCIQAVFQMHRIMLLNHLNRCAAIFGNLINVSTFKQSEGDIWMAQRIKRPPIALPVNFQAKLIQDTIELLLMVMRKETVSGFRLITLHQPFKRTNSRRHWLTISNATLATHFDF